MPIEPVGLIAIAVAALGFCFGANFIIRAFIVSTLFGSAAALILPSLGSIQPAHLMLGIVVIVAFADPENRRRAVAALRCPGPGFWLVCTWFYGVLGAYFIPRLLAEQVLVNSIGMSAYGFSFVPVPLGPSTGNITQPVYFTADLMCFFACLAVGGTEKGFKTLFIGLLIYCLADIALALIDLATFATNTVYLLDFIRNSTYVIFIDTESSTTMKRIIGSFTEASAFAGATMAVFGFALQLWLEGVRPRLTAFLAVASMALVLASTSSTAYVTLPACLCLSYAAALWRLFTTRAHPNMLVILVMLPLLGFCAVAVVLLYTPLYTALSGFLEIVLFNKSQSQSGIERARINVEAFRSFLDSGGIGTGVGSVRASSFAVAVLANLGVFGAITYGAFLGGIVFGANPTDGDAAERAIRAGARSACIYLLAAALLSGALVDLGLPFFVFSALACARPGTPAARRASALARGSLVQDLRSWGVRA